MDILPANVTRAKAILKEQPSLKPLWKEALDVAKDEAAVRLKRRLMTSDEATLYALHRAADLFVYEAEDSVKPRTQTVGTEAFPKLDSGEIVCWLAFWGALVGSFWVGSFGYLIWPLLMTSFMLTAHREKHFDRAVGVLCIACGAFFVDGYNDYQRNQVSGDIASKVYKSCSALAYQRDDDEIEEVCSRIGDLLPVVH